MDSLDTILGIYFFECRTKIRFQIETTAPENKTSHKTIIRNNPREKTSLGPVPGVKSGLKSGPSLGPASSDD